MGGQGTKWRRNIAENFNRLSRVHGRYRRQTDDRQTDGRTMTYSEPFAKYPTSKGGARREGQKEKKKKGQGGEEETESGMEGEELGEDGKECDTKLPLDTWVIHNSITHSSIHSFNLQVNDKVRQ